ncbi:GNAT family N-acetyltransferase [Streptomyces inhibens]|uniref:GNAT family N-acetyltransferase n=1 Tax=Streptomyces inhibens TaxID=2293571 RepID=UPI00369E9816
MVVADSSADLGYTLALALYGQGYATEAVRAVLGHLFRRGLRRVSAECDARNIPSARLLERVGFDLEGRRPEFTHINTGEWTDILFYGLPAGRWQKRAVGPQPTAEATGLQHG